MICSSVVFQTKNWATRLANPINDIEMWNMTDPVVKRFRLLCEARCNIVGNVYIYTNPQIAPLNLRKVKQYNMI